MDNFDRDGALNASDEELLKSCQTDHYKGTGRGGQRRNKVATAVRLIHAPSGLSVYAAESRYQRENCSKALRKLRMAIAFNHRSESKVPCRLETSLKHSEYPLWVARILDILSECEWRVSTAAAELGVGSSKLLKLIARDPKLWQFLNEERKKHGYPPLRHSK